MDVHADLTKPAELIPEHWQWVDSPQAGVRRVMLDRVGDEVAVATSFVRYAENSTFPTHQHALGEEFLVLEGEFGDEHGRYRSGSLISMIRSSFRCCWTRQFLTQATMK
jgi:anti-sigma factor ChrR (cupin superfamily)